MENFIKEWVGESYAEPTEKLTVSEKREAMIHSLAHLRLQQNGHDKREAVDWAFKNIDEAMKNVL